MNDHERLQIQLQFLAGVTATGVVSVLIGIAFLIAGPAEQSIERLCVKTAPNVTACRRL